MKRGMMGYMVQRLTGREKALLPEVQWVPEDPILQDGPVVPAMKEKCPHELAQHPCPEQMEICSGYNLRSTKAVTPKS